MSTSTRDQSSSQIAKLLGGIISLMLMPAYFAFSVTKSCMLLSIMPFTWGLKKVNPTIMTDANVTRKKLKRKIRSIADKYFAFSTKLIAK